jgi:hypothetical protein
LSLPTAHRYECRRGDGDCRASTAEARHRGSRRPRAGAPECAGPGTSPQTDPIAAGPLARRARKGRPAAVDRTGKPGFYRPDEIWEWLDLESIRKKKSTPKTADDGLRRYLRRQEITQKA